MRRKAAVAVVAILVALSFAGVAFATSHMMTGEVISANPAVRTLTVDANGLVLTFDVVDDAVDDLVDLRSGTKVAVRYTEADGERPLCHHVFAIPIGG